MSDEHDEHPVDDEQAAVDHDVDHDAVHETDPGADHGAVHEAGEEPGDERGEVEPTGHPEVDEIVSGLGRLDGLEVHEHVAEFENAHQALRRALDAGGQ